MLVKMIIVMTRRKLNRTDSYLLQLIIHILNLLTNFPCFSVSAFTVLLSYENILSQNSQCTRRSLYKSGLDSAWDWNFPPKFKKNGWALISNESEFFSKQTSLPSVYT